MRVIRSAVLAGPDIEKDRLSTFTWRISTS
jgi:hypothetical protein